MSIKRKICFSITAILGIFILFLIWYKYTYSMEELTSYDTYSPEYNTKVLIASQGSDFKNNITKNVIDHYKQDSIFIKVIDVSRLDDIETDMYNAIVIIHTWENWKPPIHVESFINKAQTIQDKIVVLTTSGNGSYKMEGLDAITGASIQSNIQLFTKEIIHRINTILKEQ